MSAAERKFPPVALGMASTVLGTIGLALSILPILGISVAFWGLVVGAVGMLRAAFFQPQELRWALVGCVVSAWAVAIGLTLAFTPISSSHINVHEPAASVPVGRPFTAPPATPAW